MDVASDVASVAGLPSALVSIVSVGSPNPTSLLVTVQLSFASSNFTADQSSAVASGLVGLAQATFPLSFFTLYGLANTVSAAAPWVSSPPSPPGLSGGSQSGISTAAMAGIAVGVLFGLMLVITSIRMLGYTCRIRYEEQRALGGGSVVPEPLRAPPGGDNEGMRLGADEAVVLNNNAYNVANNTSRAVPLLSNH